MYKNFFVHSIKMVNLSLNESKLVAKFRGIKGYKSMSEDELLSTLNASDSLKESEKNFDDTKPNINFSKPRTEKIRKEFNESRHKFSKLKINEIRRYLYEIENKKNLFAPKIKEIEKDLDELERNLSKTKKYDYDDAEYRGIKDVKDLLDLSIDEDYYKPIITNSAFNNNYIHNESKGNKDKILIVDEYLDIIRPYLSDIINNHKTQGEWRIHSGNTIIKSKTQSEWKIQFNIEIMMGSETDEIIEDLFKSLLQKYKKGLEESMKGREFIFDIVDALYYNLNKISLSRGGSYIDSPKWLKNKKATINPKINDDKCFQYALTVALNHEQIKNYPEIISKFTPFIDQYNWKQIDFSSHKEDWKKFESNNKSIALNILCVSYNIKEIRPAYVSKHNLKCENEVILLIITDREKEHYLAVKILSALSRGITSNNKGDFYCLNCFHSFRAKNKRKSIKIYVKIMIIAM